MSVVIIMLFTVLEAELPWRMMGNGVPPALETLGNFFISKFPLKNKISLFHTHAHTHTRGNLESTVNPAIVILDREVPGEDRQREEGSTQREPSCEGQACVGLC